MKLFSKTHRLFLILAIVSSSTLAAAALDEATIRSIIEKSPGLDQYPDAEIIMLYQDVTITLDSNQSMQIEDEFLLKLLTGQSKNEWGDKHMTFDSRYETIEVLAACTYTPDDQKIELMQGADNVITAPFLQNAYGFDSIKTRVVSFSSAEPGSVIYCRTRTTRVYPENDRFLSGEHLFQHTNPILEQRLTLKMKRPLTLNLRLLNGLHEPVLEDINGYRTFTWIMEQTPMIRPEYSMTPIQNFTPRLLISTATDRNQIGQWFYKRCESALIPCDVVSELVGDIVSEAASDRQKAAAIFGWVADNVHYIQISPWLSGYDPMPPPELIAHRMGDSLDISVLLAAMLQAAGIQADLVFFNSSGIKNPIDFASASVFDALGVLATLSDETQLWMDPFDANVGMGMALRGQGTPGLRISQNESKIFHVPFMKPEYSRSMQSLKIELQPNGGARIKLSWLGTGIYDFWARETLRNMTPTERNNYLANLINTFDPAMKIENITQSDWQTRDAGSSVQIQMDCPTFSVKEGLVMIASIPEFPLPFGRMDFPSGSDRETPVRLPAASIESYQLIVAAPPGYEFVYTPQKKDKNSPGLKIKQRTSLKSDQFELNRTSFFKSIELQPEQFIETRKVNDTFKNAKQNMMLLELASENEKLD